MHSTFIEFPDGKYHPVVVIRPGLTYTSPEGFDHSNDASNAAYRHCEAMKFAALALIPDWKGGNRT